MSCGKNCKKTNNPTMWLRMKIATTLLLYFSLTLLSCQQKKANIFTKAQTLISVNKGDDFIIKLEAYHEQGYEWMEISPIDTHYLQLRWIDHKKEGENKEIHYEYWHFTAKEKGESIISLKHCQHLQRNTLTDSLRFHVSIL